jgi:hypothetical protein
MDTWSIKSRNEAMIAQVMASGNGISRQNKQIGIFYKGTPKAVFALERVKIA